MRSLVLVLCVAGLACGRAAPFDLLTDAGGGGSGGGSGGGGGTTDAGSPCVGLDVAQCRQTPGCEADFCFVCSCTAQYYGCRAVTALPAGCPEVACAQPLCCQDDSVCGRPSLCAPPGTPPGCGICTPDPGTCTQDSQCGTGRICEPMPCGCNGQRHCVDGCGPQNACKTGTTCSPSTSRCEPLSCLSASCPGNFSCIGGVCVATPCASDSDCPAGFCVVGQCSLEWGTCSYPVP